MKGYQKSGWNKETKKILFIAALYKDRSPGQRFRFEQYLDYLEENGFHCEFSCLVTKKTDKVFYSKGKLIYKLFILIGFIFKRLRDVSRAKNFDLVFVQREAFFLGTTYFERQLSKRTKLVFDFDDSIWLNNVSEANKNLNFLKKASKTSKIIELADLVFAGNQYLADYAHQFNNNVRIIPTTIDSREYQKIPKTKSDKICIGWSGSFSTIVHFEHIVHVLIQLKHKYQNKIYFKVIGDAAFSNKDLEVVGLPWRKDTELNDLSEIDIGLMPLPDDEWTKGKCALKGLQYMALEIPTIMSPVGVNKDIIVDGKNGMLASTDDEWMNKLSQLIESEELRTNIGVEGRKTVVNEYSVDANKKLYLRHLSELLNETRELN